ncbi:heat shock 70 kDa protein 18-like [Silene latifolia]|uniref:heat shock 70 kDa protein 18-like n=1 Tax=Silene latifolia TaxID=37657 RepID=UPI003D76C165
MEQKDDVWPAVGIDLGTTYSCVAIWQHNRVEIITNDQGNRTTPSCVAFAHNNRLVGDAAKNQLTLNPTNTIFDTKRLIGRRYSDQTVQNDIKLWPFKVIPHPDSQDKDPMIEVTYKGEHKHFTPQEISAMILVKLKDMAESHLGSQVNNAVVTVPAYFTDSQRQATKDAGLIAGLNVMRIINEPTAAAIAYGLDHHVPDNQLLARKNILVFDVGGGTLDVSLVSVSKHVFEVRAVSGDTHLGGEDFDNRMVSHFVQEFNKKHSVDISDNPRALGRLLLACERAKRTLSVTTEATIEIDCLFDGIDFISTVTRARFERLNMDLFRKCIDLVAQCLSDAKIDKTDVDDVVLIGGSTRIPKIQQMLQRFFNGKELCKGINPDEAVAYGAAVQAATLTGVCLDKDDDFVLVDVTSLSLGIELYGGEMRVVIPRNTVIPTEKMIGNLTTVHDNQTSAHFKVYEGERCMAQNNNLLGEFNLSDIPRAPKGVPKLKASFNIDENGILTVTGEDTDTGNKKTVTVTNCSRLSKEDLNRVLKEAEKYRVEEQQYENLVKAKNTIENYANSVWDIATIYGEMVGIDCQTLKNVEDEIEKTYQWLDWNVELVEASNYVDRLRELKNISEPFVSRCCIFCCRHAEDEDVDVEELRSMIASRFNGGDKCTSLMNDLSMQKHKTD